MGTSGHSKESSIHGERQTALRETMVAKIIKKYKSGSCVSGRNW
jgi:hypothetical protein